MLVPAAQNELKRHCSDISPGVVASRKHVLTNPVFKDKVATHDLLTYALKEPGKYLAMITAEQLQHGSERIALECLMPAAAAVVVATV